MTRITIRFDFPTGAQLGPGKVRLLELIAEHGSIRAAGAAMEMSYRRAWLLADSMNRMFREPVVETQQGGRHGGGAALTPFGERLVVTYRHMEAVTHAELAADLETLCKALDPDYDAAREEEAAAG